MYIKRLNKSDQEMSNKTLLNWKIPLSQMNAFLRGEFMFLKEL